VLQAVSLSCVGRRVVVVAGLRPGPAKLLSLRSVIPPLRDGDLFLDRRQTTTRNQP
jgi:hypothetical protein